MNKRTIKDEIVAGNDTQLPTLLDEIVRAGARADVNCRIGS